MYLYLSIVNVMFQNPFKPATVTSSSVGSEQAIKQESSEDSKAHLVPPILIVNIEGSNTQTLSNSESVLSSPLQSYSLVDSATSSIMSTYPISSSSGMDTEPVGEQVVMEDTHETGDVYVKEEESSSQASGMLTTDEPASTDTISSSVSPMMTDGKEAESLTISIPPPSASSSGDPVQIITLPSGQTVQIPISVFSLHGMPAVVPPQIPVGVKMVSKKI